MSNTLVIVQKIWLEKKLNGDDNLNGVVFLLRVEKDTVINGPIHETILSLFHCKECRSVRKP